MDSSGDMQRIRILDKIAPRWSEVGCNLKIRDEHLSSIRESGNNPTKCTSAMVDRWLDSGQDPTWEKLIEALEDSELITLAKDLKAALPRMKID